MHLTRKGRPTGLAQPWSKAKSSPSSKRCDSNAETRWRDTPEKSNIQSRIPSFFSHSPPTPQPPFSTTAALQNPRRKHLYGLLNPPHTQHTIGRLSFSETIICALSAKPLSLPIVPCATLRRTSTHTPVAYRRAYCSPWPTTIA